MRFGLLAAALCLVHAETIDRIAVSVGKQVITETQIALEMRVAAFLDGVPFDSSPANRTKTTGRLIDQTLIRREMEFTRFKEASPDEGLKLLPQVKSRFQSEAQYVEALREAGVAEQDVVAHLNWQITLLRFIQYRFQPGIQVSDTDLRDFYDEQAEKWRSEGKPVLEFESVRKELEPALVSRYVDQALDRWLGEQRTQTQIVFKK